MTVLEQLYQIAYDNKITVDHIALDCTESLSLQDDSMNCYIDINPRMVKKYNDEVTKLAHELGHCLYGGFYNRYSKCDVRQKHERKADIWAIKKLIPEDELCEYVNQGYTEIWQLAELFDVTDDFMQKAVEFYISEKI